MTIDALTIGYRSPWHPAKVPRLLDANLGTAAAEEQIPAWFVH